MTSSAHIQVTFNHILPEQQDWVIAHLAEAGYEGFEQSDRELNAFIPETSFDKHYLKELAFKYQLSYVVDTIPAQNWNAVWESNFQPIVVEDFVGVRAAFHATMKGVVHEVVITPKMSFGTGHHATTWMMMRQMKEVDFNNKVVFDFGTGTGVLAILALAVPLLGSRWPIHAASDAESTAGDDVMVELIPAMPANGRSSPTWRS